VIDELYELGGTLPPRINEVRRRLASQIPRSEEGAARDTGPMIYPPSKDLDL
jgi:hypothetical protein